MNSISLVGVAIVPRWALRQSRERMPYEMMASKLTVPTAIKGIPQRDSRAAKPTVMARPAKHAAKEAV